MHSIGISRLRLSHVRSYGYLDLLINSKHVVLCGQNGAGKTNILEAISFLSPGRGLRKAKIAEVAQINQSSPWVVHASVFDGEDDVAIATGQDPSNPSRRIVKVQGNALQTHTKLSHFLNINWVTPAMDRLFLEASSVRRKFFDRLVYGLDPSHAESISKYETAMRERNKLLKDRVQNPRWLDALEVTMAQESIAIACRRQSSLNLLQEAHPFSDDPLFPEARLEFTEGLESTHTDLPPVDQEEALVRQFAANRSLDGMMGGAQIGAHKMDFTARHALKNMDAALCSTGEQKILLMWIVLAFVKLQTLKSSNVNILLLDEIAAHLDADRRYILFDKINSLNVQAWYSGTDNSLFDSLDLYHTQRFHLDHSGVRLLI